VHFIIFLPENSQFFEGSPSIHPSGSVFIRHPDSRFLCGMSPSGTATVPVFRTAQ